MECSFYDAISFLNILQTYLPSIFAKAVTVFKARNNSSLDILLKIVHNVSNSKILVEAKIYTTRPERVPRIKDLNQLMK